MSAEFMQRAFEISASDGRLTPADKLVLIRWAWKTRGPSSPYEIKFRTVARELGLSRNAVKASVGRLVACGYLLTVSVKVVAGAAFQLSEAGQSVTPQSECEGGQPVTRGGSVSDPQKGQSVTPFKKKRYKRGRDVSSGPSSVAPDPSSLTPFQRSQLLADRSLVVEGELLQAGTPRFQAWVQAVRSCHA